jgi:large subunit ribosomal protein L21
VSLNMYAVVQTGGKQYRVSPGDIIIANRLPGQDGETITLSEVLMVDDGKTSQIGSPLIDKAIVRATIVEQGRGDKIIVFKKRRRQGYRRKHGHRQLTTVMRIVEITSGNLSAKAEPKTVTKKSKLIQGVNSTKSAKDTKQDAPKIQKAKPVEAKSVKTVTKKPAATTTSAKATVKPKATPTVTGTAKPKAAPKEKKASTSSSAKPKAKTKTAVKTAEKSPKAKTKK